MPGVHQRLQQTIPSANKLASGLAPDPRRFGKETEKIKCAVKKMKTTQYFDYTRKRPDRARIKNDWIEFVVNNPAKTEVQSDGRIKMWAKIPEEDKYLRVILLKDGETVHNAFFDRSFKED